MNEMGTKNKQFRKDMVVLTSFSLPLFVLSVCSGMSDTVGEILALNLHMLNRSLVVSMILVVVL